MKVKEDKKRNKKLFSELKPGTLFRHGDMYFIKINDYIYRRRKSIANVKISCCSAFPEYDINEWDENVGAICAEDGKERSFRQSELVEVFPNAVICLDEGENNVRDQTQEN